MVAESTVPSITIITGVISLVSLLKVPPFKKSRTSLERPAALYGDRRSKECYFLPGNNALDIKQKGGRPSLLVHPSARTQLKLKADRQQTSTPPQGPSLTYWQSA